MTNSNLITILHDNGLVGASVAFNDLPIDVQQTVQQTTNIDCENRFINVFANGGASFWAKLQSSEFKDNTNPIDDFSQALALRLIETSDYADQCSVLYPSTQAVPLMQLGKLVGWSSPSPLGLGLHPQYGPWFAYRAVIVSPKPLQTEVSLIVETPDEADSPATISLGSACIDCAAPCVSACPASAVSKQDTFNIESCAGYRLQTDSTCADTCHARYACPVGQQHQYSEEQLAHHMGRSLNSLAMWFRASEPR